MSLILKTQASIQEAIDDAKTGRRHLKYPSLILIWHQNMCNDENVDVTLGLVQELLSVMHPDDFYSSIGIWDCTGTKTGELIELLLRHGGKNGNDSNEVLPAVQALYLHLMGVRSHMALGHIGRALRDNTTILRLQLFVGIPSPRQRNEDDLANWEEFIAGLQANTSLQKIQVPSLPSRVHLEDVSRALFTQAAPALTTDDSEPTENARKKTNLKILEMGLLDTLKSTVGPGPLTSRLRTATGLQELNLFGYDLDRQDMLHLAELLSTTTTVADGSKTTSSMLNSLKIRNFSFDEAAVMAFVEKIPQFGPSFCSLYMLSVPGFNATIHRAFLEGLRDTPERQGNAFLNCLSIGVPADQNVHDQLEFYTKTLNQSGCRPLLRESKWFAALQKVMFQENILISASAIYYVLRYCPGEWANVSSSEEEEEEEEEGSSTASSSRKRARFSKRLV